MEREPAPRESDSWIPPSLRALRGDPFFLGLVAALVMVTLVAPGGVATYPSRVDWPTIATLAGLLLLTKGVEASGALQRTGHWLIGRVTSERAAALGLVVAAALLSMALTNDVALFVVVPLTLGLARIAHLPSTRLVVFEALAVNVGSTLTPIGNPQNIFLWQQWGISFGGFVFQMLPLVAILLLLLVAMTIVAFPARRIRVRDDAKAGALDRALLVASLLLFAPFLVLTDLHRVGWALAGVVVILAPLRPRLLREIDWGLLLVFVLMFVDLRTLANVGQVRAWVGAIGLAVPEHLYFAGIAASQVVSNVPAAIALAEYSQDWRVIAYAVAVGGFGMMVGSLANLIALRLSGDRRAWRTFHACALPFLLISALVGYLLLF
ncbi:MAG TPA: SLC13 family permease [Casimicrobiaceae bacterium]|nr:SLC13 family permease [Casimicrobiaceae bacterium]